MFLELNPIKIPQDVNTSQGKSVIVPMLIKNTVKEDKVSYVFKEDHFAISITNGKEDVLITLNEDSTFGSSAEMSNHQIVLSRKVSRKHFRIVFKDSVCYIIDQGSKNGTYINKAKITPKKAYPIKIEDDIRVADLKVSLKILS